MVTTKYNNELLKNGLIIGMGTMVSKLLVFILVPLYSLWLTPDEYGTFDLVVTYIMLCVPFVTLQLEQAIYVFCVSQDGDSEKYYTSAVLLVLLLLLCASVAVFCAMRYVFDLEYAGAFVLYFSSFVFFNLNTEYARAKRKLVVYSVSSIAYAVFAVLFSVVAVGMLHLGLSGILSVYGFSYMLVALVLFIIYRPFKPRFFSLVTLKEMLKLSLPLLPNSVSWWITSLSNRIAINFYMGSFFNGLFAVSCKIPTIVSLLYGIFNLAFQQTAFDTLKDEGRSEYYMSLFSLLIKLLTTGCIIIVATVPFLYWIAIEQSYWTGMYCTPLLLAGAILLALAQFLGDILLAERQTGCIGKSTAVAAVATVVLNVFFVPVLGLQGAALGTFVAYIPMFVIRVHALRNHFGISRMLRLVGVCLALFGLASILVFATSTVRPLYAICSLALIGISLVANRDIAITIIRKKVKR